MENQSVKFRRAKETNFLVVDEIIFDMFSPYALKVYGQLRKQISYKKECDDIEITVKNLAQLSGISERKTFDVLNELEHTHHIIQRTNIYHFRRGQINTFEVSQTYGYYKTVQSENTPAQYAEPVDNTVQKLPTPAQYAEGTAQYAEGTAQYAYLNKQEYLQEVSQEKQYKNLVTVFSCKEAVKTHIEMVIANRKDQEPLDDGIIDQGIYYAFETNSDKAFDAVNKRINIFLKKVREGKWLIPQGWNGITSQSIRETEEQEQQKKQIQYQQEAEAFRAISKAVLGPVGENSLQIMMKKLKS